MSLPWSLNSPEYREETAKQCQCPFKNTDSCDYCPAPCSQENQDQPLNLLTTRELY